MSRYLKTHEEFSLSPCLFGSGCQREEALSFSQCFVNSPVWARGVVPHQNAAVAADSPLQTVFCAFSFSLGFAAAFVMLSCWGSALGGELTTAPWVEWPWECKGEGGALAADFTNHGLSSGAALGLQKMLWVNNKPGVKRQRSIENLWCSEFFTFLVVNCCCETKRPQNKAVGFEKTMQRLCETMGSSRLGQ